MPRRLNSDQVRERFAQYGFTEVGQLEFLNVHESELRAFSKRMCPILLTEHNHKLRHARRKQKAAPRSNLVRIQHCNFGIEKCLCLELPYLCVLTTFFGHVFARYS